MTNGVNVQQASTRKEKISDEDRQRMIAAAAYRLAEERGFEQFSSETDPKQDWIAAEKQIDAYLSERI